MRRCMFKLIVDFTGAPCRNRIVVWNMMPRKIYTVRNAVMPKSMAKVARHQKSGCNAAAAHGPSRSAIRSSDPPLFIELIRGT